MNRNQIAFRNKYRQEWFCPNELVKDFGYNKENAKALLYQWHRKNLLQRSLSKMCRCTGRSHHLYKFKAITEPSVSKVEPQTQAPQPQRYRTSPIDKAITNALGESIAIARSVERLKSKGLNPKTIKSIVGIALMEGLKQ